MKNVFIVCVFFVTGYLLPGSISGQGRDEFNGPFKGWVDVKKDFGAKGNGKDDDTRALQNSLNNLSCPPMGFNEGKGGYMVIYLPAGTYCISSTLVLKGKIGVSFIGEDPQRTVIKWTGGDKDTLFWANGSSYFKVSRITWDAGGRKDMEGIGVHWKEMWNDGKSRSFASLNIEISDCIFFGGFKYGISGGTYGGKNGTGNNDSELAIKRCIFRNCSGSGIEIQGYNAIDYWIWDCQFIFCNMGVNCSHGNYHVYRSYFSGSKVCDVHNDNGYYVSVRGCYSENSNAFSLDAGMSSNPFKRVFQDNTIVNPGKLPVEYYHLGKITLFGNVFTKTRDTTNAFSVNTASWSPGIYEVLSLHNKYAYKQPIRIGSNPHTIYSFGDAGQAAASVSGAAFLKTMDHTPAKVRRKIFEVPAGADASVILGILNQALLLKGQRPIVHFGMGTYYIDRSLEVSAGADMQLIGDGLIYATVIRRKGKFPILHVKGPSYITIKDLQLGTDGDKGQSDGIVFENVDQPRSEAHLDQVYSHADTSLFVEGTNYLYVEKDNSFFTEGNYISGGKLIQQGKGTAGLFCFGGQFAGLTVKQNAGFLARDCWWEGARRIPLDISGSGRITVDGAMIAPTAVDSQASIRIGRFDGSINLMNMYVQGGLSVQGDNPGLALLIWNIHFYHKVDILGFLKDKINYKGAFLGINTQCFKPNDPTCKSIISVADQVRNIPDVNSFLDGQTIVDRSSSPTIVRQLPAGVSNIVISRVSLGAMPKAIVVTSSD